MIEKTTLVPSISSIDEHMQKKATRGYALGLARRVCRSHSTIFQALDRFSTELYGWIVKIRKRLVPVLFVRRGQLLP
jgi:hypothetical protein